MHLIMQVPSPPKLFSAVFILLRPNYLPGERLRGRLYCCSHHPVSTAGIPNEKLLTLLTPAAQRNQAACASPWLHRTSPCRSSRTWHQVVSVGNVLAVHDACTPPPSHSQSLTRTAGRSQNPHRRPRVSPHFSLRKAHLLFSLDPRHPQTLERSFLRLMDV